MIKTKNSLKKFVNINSYEDNKLITAKISNELEKQDIFNIKMNIKTKC